MRARTFWLHIHTFDDPHGRIWGVTLGDDYLIARTVDCQVPTETVYRGRGRQPYAYLRGKGIVSKRGTHITIRAAA
jgi:hypothetical protein